MKKGKLAVSVRAARADDYEDINGIWSCPGAARDTLGLPYISLDASKKRVEDTIARGDNWLNLKRVELHVYTDNARAIHLYEKFGFVTEDTHRAFAFRDGEYVDAYSMARVREQRR